SLLGGMEIGPAGGAGETSIARKAGAMIAYLALQDGHAQTRDKLAGLFWSRNTDEQARTNLRQALSRLRKAMANGDEAPLLASAECVALDMAHIELDVQQFESLLGEGRTDTLERAMDLYRGDLLDGLSLNESDFDHWLWAERERLRVLAVDALLKLIDGYEATSDLNRCVDTSLRLLSIDPLQEPAHRALMRAYASQGRYGMALQQYESCRELLGRELQVEPEPETVALFDDIRHRRSNGNGATRAAPFGEPVDLTIPDRPSIAVLPFANRGGDDYFVDGITENILAGLTRFHDLFVISGPSAFALNSPDLEARQAGKRLGVAHILEGAVQRTDSRVRVTVQLVDTRDGRHLWAEKYDRDADDLLAVQDDITTNIVASLAGQVEDASRLRAETKPPENMAAYDYLLRARYGLKAGGREDVMEARRLFDQALELDPSLAAAWAGLAVSHITEYESEWSSEGRLHALGQAQGLAERAVALDDGCAFGHWTLAGAHFYMHHDGLATFHIDRAIALNPNEYKNYCVKGWILVFSGKPADGIACALEGRRINPLASAGCHINVGIGEYTVGEYQASIDALRGGGKFGLMRDVFMAAAYAQLGDRRKASQLAAGIIPRSSRLVEPYGGPEKTRWRAYLESVFPYQNTGDMEHLLDGLRKAGMPV
ncbi:MAG: BTAD domain-containing putative transcriptional regulator, partial [Pseudomonadota bacterium]